MSEINDIGEIPDGDFPINLNIIDQYQQTGPSLMDKYEDGTYYKGSFRGGSNIDLRLRTCKDKIIIQSIIQNFVLH